MKARISIIIVNYEGADLTRDCAGSLMQHASPHPHEIIIVDSNSPGNDAATLEQSLPACRVFASRENRGFGWANNLGASRAEGEFLFFLNNDTTCSSDVVTPLVEFMEANPRCGIAAPALRNADGTVQISGGKYPSILHEWSMRKSMRRGSPSASEALDWVSGAAMMVRRSVFDLVGGFDERYFLYFEDADLCRRIADAGFTINHLSGPTLIHLGGRSREKVGDRVLVEYRRSQLHFYDKFNSLPERLALRFYLFGKFTLRLLTAPGRPTSLAILGLIFKSRGNSPGPDVPPQDMHRASGSGMR